MPSLFYDACSQILIQTALVLAGFYAEAQTPAFHCEHKVLPEVAALLERYTALKEDAFSDLNACQEWLLSVAAILPELWD